MKPSTAILSSLFLSIANPANATDTPEQILQKACSIGKSVAFHGHDDVGEYSTRNLIFAYCKTKQVAIMTCFMASKTLEALIERQSTLQRNPDEDPAALSRAPQQIKTFEDAINENCDLRII